jgi:hypothetical protein
MSDVVKLIEEHDIEGIQVLATANQFKAGHPICLDMTRRSDRNGCGDECQMHSLPRLQQQDGEPQDLSGRRASITSLAAGNTGSKLGL